MLRLPFELIPRVYDALNQKPNLTIQVPFVTGNLQGSLESRDAARLILDLRVLMKLQQPEIPHFNMEIVIESGPCSRPERSRSWRWFCNAVRGRFHRRLKAIGVDGARYLIARSRSILCDDEAVFWEGELVLCESAFAIEEWIESTEREEKGGKRRVRGNDAFEDGDSEALLSGLFQVFE